MRRLLHGGHLVADALAGAVVAADVCRRNPARWRERSPAWRRGRRRSCRSLKGLLTIWGLISNCKAGGIMACYRINVVASRNGVVSSSDLTCATEREACVVAESMLEPGLRAEIWTVGERVRVVTVHRTATRPALANSRPFSRSYSRHGCDSLAGVA